MAYADFHTHSHYSDGRYSLSEMAEFAMNHGMYALGFSDHSPMDVESDWTMPEDKYADYISEISKLKNDYSGKLEIFTGLELDIFSELDTSDLDYLIVSCHYVLTDDGIYCPVDHASHIMKNDVDKHFSGDCIKYAKKYYEQLASVSNLGPAVIGHYDLVTKFNEGGCMFDESDPRYINTALETLEYLASLGIIFEINTGAMFRGYRTEPYPSLPLLRRMKELGCKIMLNGDSHSTEALCHKFDDAIEYAKAAGYTDFEKYPPMRK